VAITSQPATQTVAVGQSATFTVAATGSSLTYQWQKNGTPISGATSASYSIASASAGDAANYSVVVTSGSTSVTSAAATLTVNAVVSADPGRLKNLSVLTPLGVGETLTFGFVVGPTGATGSKPLLIRAGGPALTAVGFSAAAVLSDPKLDFFNGSTKIGSNDNWASSDPTTLAAQAATGAFAFGSNSLDSVIYLPAAPSGNLSAIVSGPSAASGSVIAEVYDATPAGSFTATSPRLVNVSVIKNVGTGFTMGFVLTGSTNTQVLIRAVGPTLTTALGIQGAAPDPKMTLFNGASVAIGSNDNWETPVGTGATGAQIAAATAKVTPFVLGAGSKDAAILATLAPNQNYTVTVNVTGADGLGLVEVYEVP
jgi:hypothetical protein